MRLLVRIACYFLTVFTAFSATAQSLWTESPDKKTEYFSARSNAAKPSAYKLLNVNAARLKRIQVTVPFINENGSKPGVPIEIPLPNGNMHLTTIVETSIWQNGASPNPNVKTYSMINPQTSAFEGNILIANGGISGTLFTENGLVYIAPLNIDNSGAHMVYYTKDVSMKEFICGTSEVQSNNTGIGAGGRIATGDGKARVYRLAVAATGEYTAWAGSATNANNLYIPILVNFLNAIYKRDLNITFVLVPNNIAVVFTDASTDPYTTGGATATMLNENQLALDANIGSGNYDVGIVVTRASGGGIASLSSVCSSGKGRGACGDNNGIGTNPTPGPQGQWFDGATAHELGHMFGATHTFVGTQTPNCGGNRNISTSWEPGSGSTLMAYGGAGCGSTNAIQTYQDYYFHGGSIAQMQNFIASGFNCIAGIETGNTAPVITTVSNVSNAIPANTPFMLRMTATDPNNDVLTYTWEQMDADFTGSGINHAVPPSSTNTSGPLFRSRPPASNLSTRYFPALYHIINPNDPNPYEVLPSVARTLNFRGTVRDNSALGGRTSQVNLTLNVQPSPGFTVLNPGFFGTLVWNKNGNNTALVEWDVVNTANPPINCTAVDILLSTDGGNTFPIVLASAVPNTGSYNVPIPSVNTTQGKVMVKATNNVFFNVNEFMLTISDPLPVTFLSFNVRKEGKTALITWSTATEINSDKFIIERSANGTDFTTQVGTVRAAGNSNSVKSYSLVDATPLTNWNYYRLKQVDIDGKITYSKTVSVYFSKGNSTIVSLFPNPVKNTTTVDLYTEKGGIVYMDVFDNKGALVMKKTYGAVTGQNRVILNIAAFTSGIYTLKCYSNSELIGVTKLIKE